jgi:hypothetical protein
MKWFSLYNKIGRQDLFKMKKFDVYAIIDDKNILLDIKFRPDGSPYLVQKEK